MYSVNPEFLEKRRVFGRENGHKRGGQVSPLLLRLGGI